MIYSLFFILAFSLGAFAQKNAPGPFESGDELSYRFLLGELEYYLRQKDTSTKPCYMPVKEEYFQAIQKFGWDIKSVLEQGTLVNLGTTKKERQKIESAANILRQDIGGPLNNKYHGELGKHIQGVHYDRAALLLNRHREAIKENFESYKRVMGELKKLKAKNYDKIENMLKKYRQEFMTSTENIYQKFEQCIKEQKCKPASS